MVLPDEFVTGSRIPPAMPGHPSWCAEDRDGIHYSAELPHRGTDRVIQAAGSLFRMDGLPVPLVGVNLRLSAADLVEEYPLDLDQARILAWTLRRLVRRAGGSSAGGDGSRQPWGSA